jgi:purine-binding chemotaxis protein CheW
MDFLSIRKKARKKGEPKEASPAEAPSAAPAGVPEAPAAPAAPTGEGAAGGGERAPAPAPPPAPARRRERTGEGAIPASPAELQERFEGLAPSPDGRFATWRPGSSAPPIEPDQQALVPRAPEPPPPHEEPGEEPPTARPQAGFARLEPLVSPFAAPPADPLDTFFYRFDEDSGDVPTFGHGPAPVEPLGEAGPEALDEYLTFALGGEEYAVPVADVREVMRAPTVTEVPRAPAHILGVITVRGEVVAVMDARSRLGLGKGDAASAGRIVIVDAGLGSVGLLVDAVRNVVRLPRGAVEPCPRGIASSAADCVTGIGRHRERLFMVVDPAALLPRTPGAEG